jgi:hypothetical protein
MQDGNIKVNVEAQYNQKRWFLQPPLLNCKSISAVEISQHGSSGRLYNWLDYWECRRAPRGGGKIVR